MIRFILLSSLFIIATAGTWRSSVIIEGPSGRIRTRSEQIHGKPVNTAAAAVPAPVTVSDVVVSTRNSGVKGGSHGIGHGGHGGHGAHGGHHGHGSHVGHGGHGHGVKGVQFNSPGAVVVRKKPSKV